jgi:hypothetical protein
VTDEISGGNMNKISFPIIITAVLLLGMLSACGETTPATTGKQTTETTQTTTLTTPANIEVEYELMGNETRGLLSVYELEAVAKAKEVDVTGVVASVRIARSNVDITAEFYDSSGTLLETLSDSYILDASQTHSSERFTFKYYCDNPSQVAKCKLYIEAYE